MLGQPFLYWSALVLSLAALGCDEQRDDRLPEAPPGPVAHIFGRVMRGNHPVAGVHALARVTYGIGCSVHDSAPGGTMMMMTPTDSTGRFQVMASPAWTAKPRPGCLYVGAVDTVRAETAWAAPRRVPAGAQKDSSTGRVPILQIDVPWPNAAEIPTNAR
jgi:hypothetical protein